MSELKPPFPYFGGKRLVANVIWPRFGRPKQYIEPFCGSCSMLLAAPRAASLEVVGDANGFIANFWRSVKYQPDVTAKEADYPVSHVDMGARHVWLMEQRGRIGELLQDPEWPGDARVAGWWLWGQCSWIGSGWCDWFKMDAGAHVGNAGQGIQATGQIPHVGNAGRGIQATGQIPHVSDAGMLTSAGETAWEWLHKLAGRLGRVRVLHGDWSRCLNHHYGGKETAVFFDPPYRSYEQLYGCAGVADAVEDWCAEHPDVRICLAGHAGDYPKLEGWSVHQWSRGATTYGSSKTTDQEALWFSPACEMVSRQASLFEVNP